jgi:hypothetical protein
MRSLIVSIFVIAVMISAMSTPALSQTSPIDKGVWQLSGGISFTSFGGDYYKQGNDSPTEFSFTPGANYFVTDGIAVGAKILYSRFSVGSASTSQFGIGPEVTYYFNINKEKSGKGVLYPYLGVAYLYTQNTDKYPGDPDHKDRLTTFAIDGGAAYMLTNSVGLFGQLEYDADSFKHTEPAPAGQSVSGSRISFFTGFTFFIY